MTAPATSSNGGIHVQIVSLVWGVLAFLGMVIALLPGLSMLNWFSMPFAGVGVILSGIALATAKPVNRGAAIAALVANGIALAIGIIRLVLGGGIL
jgi:signal transduction histidine kinase